jgi:hypothetical protein
MRVEREARAPTNAVVGFLCSESKHYFWGAHTVRHYTKKYPEHVVAIQLESPMVWRKDEALRRTYAEALAEAMVDFVKEEMLPL